MDLLRSGVSLLVGVLPVLVFLLALTLLDSYKLVRPRRVGWLLVAGGVAAALALLLNRTLAAVASLDRTQEARFLAPVVEELLKGAVVVALIVRRRVGFLVDAAIAGFAVGAGFAAVENVHYLFVLARSDLLLWLVRGFGTALMHGSLTAVMAILAKLLGDRRGADRPAVYLIPWLLVIALHSAFNHFYVSPDLTTVVMLVLLPAFFVVVFHLSEGATREWLGVGFDSDVELLQLIQNGEVSQSQIGRYLAALTERFPPATVVDMLCLLRLRVELSIRAKGILIMRQAGFPAEPDPEVAADFAELRFLERSIGRTGMLAIAPFFRFSDRDLWQYHMLADGAREPSQRGAGPSATT